jgi:hypothetical protein
VNVAGEFFKPPEVDMKIRSILAFALIAIVLAAPVMAKSKAGRRAGKGAAMGAIWGLVVGGSVESAARHAAAGAAMGAASGAIDDSYAKKDAKRAAEEQARQAEAERQAVEAERARLEAEKRRLEEQMAVVEAQEAQAAGTTDAEIEAEWIEAIGEDNWNGLIALVECQYQRAHLLAQAAATMDNQEFQLASLWLEAMILVDQKKPEEANGYFEQIAARDPEIDTVQQASIEVDKAILDVRDYRREEGISCDR